MDIPAALIKRLFEPKGLYYFESTELNSSEPHYFIIVEIQGNIFHLVVCTTKFEKRKKYLEAAGLDSCTLVWVQPSVDNDLTEDSFVDCNTVFSNYTMDAFENKVNSGALQFRGQISDSEYYQIMNGIISSLRIDKAVIDLVKNCMDNFNNSGD